jgi:hypothetical protein
VANGEWFLAVKRRSAPSDPSVPSSQPDLAGRSFADLARQAAMPEPIVSRQIRQAR